MKNNHYDIVLTIMPFAPILLPPLNIGLLTASLKENNLNVGTTFPALRLCNKLGITYYNNIFRNWNCRETLFGDWLFSNTVYKENTNLDKKYLKYFQDNIIKNKPKNNLDKNSELTDYVNFPKDFEDNNKIFEIRKICEAFLQEEVEKILKMNPKIVACTSSYSQHIATIGLMKMLKTRNPQLITMIGGSNCEAEIGYETLKCFKWIDYLFSGEGDKNFPLLCKMLLDKNQVLSKNEIPFGVYTKEKIKKMKQNFETSIVKKINDVSFPEFDNYYEEYENEKIVKINTRALYVEHSRGCQKGEKVPCAFCGLNGTKYHYRCKSSERFLKELDYLYKKYNSSFFLLTDSMLGNSCFTTWLKDLSKDKKYYFFVEILSTLNEEKVKLLAKAGVFYVQSGIENLNSSLLKLMNKGNSAIHNIALLKYLYENSIICHWNFLVNIPGEKDEYYQKLTQLIPLVEHLIPPICVDSIVYCKFSEFYKNPKKYGLKLVPFTGYKYIYKEKKSSIKKLAYFFYNYSRKKNFEISANKYDFLKKLHCWQRRTLFSDPAKKKDCIPKLLINEKNKLLIISDSREIAISSIYYLNEVDSKIYMSLRSPISYDLLVEKIKNKQVINILEERLSYFIKNNLVLKMDDKYLALATNYPINNDKETEKVRTFYRNYLNLVNT